MTFRFRHIYTYSTQFLKCLHISYIFNKTKNFSNEYDSKGIYEASINYSLIGTEQCIFMMKLDSEKLITYLKEMILTFHSD